MKNRSDESTAFDVDNETLINKKGQEFSSTAEARAYLEDSNTFLEELNPGNQLTGTIVFDIPR